MTYNDKLHDKVREHPMDEFREMGKLEEGDDYGAQFAELLNALSTNVIIPVEDTDILKQWVVEYGNGERVYAEIGGKLAVAEPAVESPSGVDDINIKSVGIDQSALENEIQSSSGPAVQETPPENPTQGDGWIDSSYRRPAKKVYVDDTVGWKTLVGGSNLPESKKLTPDRVSGGTKTFDVSDLDQEVYFNLASDRGGDGQSAIASTDDWDELKSQMAYESRKYYNFDGVGNIQSRELTSSSGNGVLGKVRIDLSQYDELNVELGIQGSSGSSRTHTKGGGDHKTKGVSANGGNGVKITDKYGNPIAYASGGGGGSAHGSWEYTVYGQGHDDEIFLHTGVNGGNGALYHLDGSNRGGGASVDDNWGDERASVSHARDGSVKAPGAGSTNVINTSPRSVIGGTYIETFVESKR